MGLSKQSSNKGCMSSKTSTTIRKEVSFSSLSELYEFDDYHTETRSACWYSYQDYVRFEQNKQEDLQALRRVRNNRHRINPYTNCERGLETRMSKRSMSILLHRRMNLVAAVLQEQRQQVADGVRDDAKISQIAGRATFGPAMEALERGITYGMQNVNAETPRNFDEDGESTSKRHKRSWSLELEYEADDDSSVRQFTIADKSTDKKMSPSEKQQLTDCFQESLRSQPSIPSWKQFLSGMFQSKQ